MKIWPWAIIGIGTLGFLAVRRKGLSGLGWAADEHDEWSDEFIGGVARQHDDIIEKLKSGCPTMNDIEHLYFLAGAAHTHIRSANMDNGRGRLTLKGRKLEHLVDRLTGQARHRFDGKCKIQQRKD